MEKRVAILLLVMAVSIISDVADGKAKARVTLSRIDRKLKLINKPAVKTIKSEDGDIIDCIDMHKQPAFDHPKLRNHKIQMRPSFDLPKDKLDNRNESSRQMIFQAWQRSGSCPTGTVPIRRIRKQDLIRAASLEQFGTKPPMIPTASNKTVTINSQSPPINNTKLQIMTMINRSVAILVTVGYNYIGTRADLNIWKPTVDLPDDYTTAQMWLKNGPGDNFESIEAGWAINPKLYGDDVPRLFAYWTKDAYKTTGCFDLTCAGFVQTNPRIALGVALSGWSGRLGPQYQVTVGIFRDPNTENWWLRFGDADVIGYWPKALFVYLSHSSTMVHWGGEVYSQNVKKSPHTKTQMGSGEFARNLYASASYIKHVRIQDYSSQFKYPEWVGYGTDEEECYTAYNFAEGYNEPVFYFGGPGGQTPRCV